MLFPREGLLSQIGQSFDDRVRPALPTVAEPAWFAPPVDVQQDDNAITVVFDIAGHDVSDLRVEASGRNIYLWGPALEAARSGRGCAASRDACLRRAGRCLSP